jgi:hypothetical protein
VFECQNGYSLVCDSYSKPVTDRNLIRFDHWKFGIITITLADDDCHFLLSIAACKALPISEALLIPTFRNRMKDATVRVATGLLRIKVYFKKRNQALWIGFLTEVISRKV